MDVARAAGVGAGHDRLQPEAARRVGELVATAPEAGEVSTRPPSTSRGPGRPGSSSDTRWGERALKNGPAVCSGVGSWSSAQAGVAGKASAPRQDTRPMAGTASKPRIAARLFIAPSPFLLRW
jgi:hypothetical protein